ncbi:MerR-like helix-turn-helix DNA binding domain protein [Arthrobacter phage Zaheer]|uniref:MerR-like helix-turn-helix DNA binding domain protein n=1 Tax=Arthrobacter phage Zaheer TaxID=2836041 RepID=A0A8F3E923_9CAUD|nr:MerR-like helix-turn-helix DNA binding domain protein [Arthrobacter phage Zaheer]QWY84268.1 MerR-like helix-turn-helix DNA binding domain protein [Arthrobacter phage Zaheer]
MQSRYTQVADAELLTVGQAAAELGVHGDTIRRWAKAGKIFEIRTPTGHRRFRAPDIAAIKNGDCSDPPGSE